jgi:hypothetical protein
LTNISGGIREPRRVPDDFEFLVAVPVRFAPAGSAKSLADPLGYSHVLLTGEPSDFPKLRLLQENL